MDDCLFCKIVAGNISANKIFENKYVLAFLDINPVSIGHTLVIPKHHSNTLFELEEKDSKKLFETVKHLGIKIQKVLDADGMNVNINSGKAAGQIIFHTHVHLIPRFSNDGFKHWHGRRKYSTEELFKIAEKIRSNL